MTDKAGNRMEDSDVLAPEISSTRRVRRRTAKAVTYAKEEERFGTDDDTDIDEKPTARRRVMTTKARKSAGDGDGVVYDSGAYANVKVFTEKGYDHDIPIRQRYTFEPEFEDDGTRKIDVIVGRRPIEKLGGESNGENDGSNSALINDSEAEDGNVGDKKLRRREKRLKGKGNSPADAKASTKKNSSKPIEYEYLVKYKGMSYMHLDWTKGSDLESLNKSAKAIYRRYLKKIEQGGDETLEDFNTEPAFTEPARILDEKDEKIFVDLDDNELMAWEKEQEASDDQDYEYKEIKDVANEEKIDDGTVNSVDEAEAGGNNEYQDEVLANDTNVEEKGEDSNDDEELKTTDLAKKIQIISTKIEKDGLYYPRHPDSDNPYRDGYFTEPPKKPRASYLFYQCYKRSQFQMRHRGASVSEVMTLVGEGWRELNDEEREPYTELAKMEIDRYKEEMILLEKAQRPGEVWQPIRRCKQVLERLTSDNYASVFLEPVNVDSIPDYLDYVETPMDLGTVRSRLEKKKYQSPEQFARDCRKIWLNCKVYNQHGSAIWNLADFMSKQFERLYYCWVTVFKDRHIRWSTPSARPWENSCRIHDGSCGSADDKMVSCDLCDGKYGKNCLSPPLSDALCGVWHCSICESNQDKSKTRMFSAISDLATRKRAELIDVPKKKIIQKMYLIKWAGLGYSDCSWEVASDINDDGLIQEYYRLNNMVPDEPILTQSEVENVINASKHPTPKKIAVSAFAIADLRSQLYAQTRSFHFLKFGLEIPEKLGSECGPSMRNEVMKKKDYLPEVIDCLTDVVFQVCRGQINTGIRNDRQTLTGEYDVATPITADGIMLNVKNIENKYHFLGNRELENSPGNHTSIINCGDEIISVNGLSLAKNTLEGTLGYDRKTHIQNYGKVNFAHIRLVKASYSSPGLDLTSMGSFGEFYTKEMMLLFRMSRGNILGKRINENIGLNDVEDESDHTSNDESSSDGDEDSFADELSIDHSEQNDDETTSLLSADVRLLEIQGCKNGIQSRCEIKSDDLVKNDENNLVQSMPIEQEKESPVGKRTESTTSMSLRLLDMELDYTSDEGGGEESAFYIDGIDSTFSSSHDKSTTPLNSKDLSSRNQSSSKGNRADEEKLPVQRNEFNSLGNIAKLTAAISITHSKPIVTDFINYPGPSPATLAAMEAEKLRRAALKSDVGSKKSNTKVEQIDPMTNEVLFVWATVEEAAAALSVSAKSITQVLKGEYNEEIGDECGGYRWRYADESQEVTTNTGKKGKKQATSSFQDKLYDHSNPHTYKGGHKLRDYQIDGVNWLARSWYKKHCCILADEMGLGKTVQIVAYLEHLFRVEKLRQPFLIVVPLSTLGHWEREFKGWTDMQCCLYHDRQREWRDVMREYEWYFSDRPHTHEYLKFHVLVTTYDTLIGDFDVLGTIPWGVCVVDEAHRLRNIKGKLLECMKQIALKGTLTYGYQSRILVTGTPLQNNIQELWTLLNYIEPSKFSSLDDFLESYGNMANQAQVESLQKKISPFMLRRVKEDVAKDIPAKEETIIDVELTTLQKQYYRAVFEQNLNFLSMGKGTTIPKLMNIQMELRKCCNHPFLLDGIEQKETEKTYEELVASGQQLEKDDYRKRLVDRCLVGISGKMVLLDKLLPKLRQEGHKVLIFSQMVRMLDLISDFLDFRGFRHERLDGRVRGNERQKAIDRFESDPDDFVFLLSTRAGGVGINLTAADICIIFDSDWNPQNDVQAQARCHRIGQTKDVMIYRLVTAKTFEQEMFNRASKKLGLERAVLGTFGQDNDDDKPDAKEMELLLKKGAYALREGDDEEAKVFCEDDIDSILANRTRTRVVEGAQTAAWLKNKNIVKKSKFSGKNSAATANVDVDDPLFWQKVMPDFVTPLIMFNKLKKMTEPKEIETSQKKRSSKRKQSFGDSNGDNEFSKATIKQANKFMADLSSLMDGIFIENEDRTLHEDEKELCRNLLLKLSLKVKLFTREQRDRAKLMLVRLEGDRRRRCRKGKDKQSRRYGSAAELTPDVDEVKNEKLMIRSKVKKRRGESRQIKGKNKVSYDNSAESDSGEEIDLSDAEKDADNFKQKETSISRREMKRRKWWASEMDAATAAGCPWPAFSRTDMLKVFQTLMDKLLELDRKSGGSFSEPVPQNIPNYYDVITDPMDYGTMRKKLLQGVYRSSQAVQRDFQLIMSNCRTFNDSKSDIVKIAQKHALQIPNFLKASALENNIFIDEDGTVIEVLPEDDSSDPKKIPRKKRKRHSKSDEDESIADENHAINKRKRSKRGRTEREQSFHREVKTSKFHSDSDREVVVPVIVKPKKRIPCKKCPGCLREDCGKCPACISKPKFGGDGNLKKRCVLRRCAANHPLPKVSSKSKKVSNDNSRDGGTYSSKPRIRINLSSTPTNSKKSLKETSPRKKKSPRPPTKEESEAEEGEINENDSGRSKNMVRINSKKLKRQTDLIVLKANHQNLSTNYKEVRNWVTSLGPWQVPSTTPKPQCEILMFMTVDKMSRYDKHDLFAREVTEVDAPGYYEEIENPIDFGTMRSRIKDGFYGLGPDGLSALFPDYILMFDNCIQYNGTDSDVGREASRVLSYLPVVFAICFEAVFGSNVGKIPKKKERI